MAFQFLIVRSGATFCLLVNCRCTVTFLGVRCTRICLPSRDGTDQQHRTKLADVFLPKKVDTALFLGQNHQNPHQLMLDIVILPHLFESDFYSSHTCCMSNCCVAFLQQWVLLSLDSSSTRSEEKWILGSLHGIHAKGARTGTRRSAMSST